MTEHRDYVNMRTGELGTFDDHVTWIEERALARGKRGASTGSAFFCDETYGSVYCTHLMDPLVIAAMYMATYAPKGERSKTPYSIWGDGYTEEGFCTTCGTHAMATYGCSCNAKPKTGEREFDLGEVGTSDPPRDAGATPVSSTVMGGSGIIIGSQHSRDCVDESCRYIDPVSTIDGMLDWCGVCENGRFSSYCRTCGRTWIGENELL